jgi:tRNA uridine 5-carboxymethylaminomethyl modification enzyme
MHTGESKTPGGRFGEAAATGISAALSDLGFELGRLKTGTPPRLRRDSIRWNELVAQHGDKPPVPFSDLSASGAELHEAPSLESFPVLPQVECRQTSTNASSHQAIRSNLHRAPMFSGQIEGRGPRYCPSIEDKVVRFADRDAHGVFLEPESLEDDWIYCNGISTSLPSDVQDTIVRSMPGCEAAVIYRYGYAVEYDMVRPHQIFATGQTKLVRGLFLAGQINGTSGYEEAAAQGLVAGVNAVRFARGESEWVIGREQAYIGVLMDDLVTKTPLEPYRMFTSRAEHRLLLRADNAAERLTPIARELGLLSGELGTLRAKLFDERSARIAQFRAAITARASGTPLTRLVRSPEFTEHDLASALSDDAALGLDPNRRSDAAALLTTYADIRYEPYIQKARAEIRRQAEIEHRRLPDGLNYRELTALRNEAREALDRFRPATFGQAGRLEGITPSDLTLLAVLVKRRSNYDRGCT